MWLLKMLHVRHSLSTSQDNNLLFVLESFLSIMLLLNYHYFQYHIWLALLYVSELALVWNNRLIFFCFTDSNKHLRIHQFLYVQIDITLCSAAFHRYSCFGIIWGVTQEKGQALLITWFEEEFVVVGKIDVEVDYFSEWHWHRVYYFWVPGYRQRWKCECIVFTRNCCSARMLPGEAELVPEWTGLSGDEV